MKNIDTCSKLLFIMLIASVFLGAGIYANTEYTITNYYWSDQLDVDGDGYCQYRKLNVDINISEGSAFVYVGFGMGSGEGDRWSFYSDTVEISAGSNTNMVTVDVGFPVDEVFYGSYPCFFSLHVVGIIGIAAHVSYSELQSFETSTDDKVVGKAIYSFENVSFSDSVDLDEDNICYSSKINFEVKPNGGNHNVFAKIFTQGPGGHQYYYTSGYFKLDEITGSVLQQIEIGGANGQLSGDYYLIINVYDSVNGISFGRYDDWVRYSFETQEKDKPEQEFIIKNYCFTDMIDNDGDGYYSYKKLNVDVDVSQGTAQAFVVVYIETGEDLYKTYSSNIQTVTEYSTEDAISVELGFPGNEIEYGGFKVSFKVFNKDTVEVGEGNFLYTAQCFESYAGDKVFGRLKFETDSIFWSDIVDNDFDGRMSSGKFNFRITSNSPNQIANAEILFAGSKTAINDILIGEDSASFVQQLSVNNRSGTFDFFVNLYESSSGFWMGRENRSEYESALNDVEFELEEDDCSPIFTLDSIWFNKEVDSDKDGYFSHRRFMTDINVNKGSHLVFLCFEYDLGEGDGYIFNSPVFEVSGSSIADSNGIEIGLPETVLSHNNYRLSICVKSANNHKKLASFGYYPFAQKYETPEEDAIPGITIDSVWFTNSVDADGDGYFSHRKIMVDANLSSGSHEVEFDFVFSSEHGAVKNYKIPNIILTGSALADSVGVEIGLPETILIHNDYDLTVRVRSTTLASHNYIIRVSDGHKYETPNQDATFVISDVWWTKEVDKDRDSYYSKRRLNFIMNTDVGQRNLQAILSSCKMPVMAGPCNYDSTDVFTVSAMALSGTQLIDIGFPNRELDSGNYLLQLLVIDFDTKETIINYESIVEPAGFEPADKDLPPTFEIDSVWWNNDVDLDGDTAYSHRTLNVDINTNGGTHQIFVIVYCTPIHMSNPTWYYSSESFNVSGNSGIDSQMLDIGIPNSELDSGSYHVQIQVIDFVTMQPLTPFYSVGSCFLEKLEQDLPKPIFSVDSCWWSNLVDLDADAFFCKGELNFIIDISDGEFPVYSQLFYKAIGAKEYQLYAEGAKFLLSSDSESIQTFSVGLPNEEFINGVYDFKLKLLHELEDRELYVYCDRDTKKLNDIHMETMKEDEIISNLSDINSSFSIFPSITSDKVNIDFIASERVSLKVYRLDGVLILEQVLFRDNTQISLAEFGKGLYIFNISAENYNITRKVVLQ